MTPDIFAEWMRLQGQRVIRTESSYWCDTGYGVFQAFPYHWVINPSEEELRTFLTANKAIALRYSTPFDNQKGLVSYHVTCDDPGYDKNQLKRQTRQNINRGLKSCDIERIELARLADEGWQLRKETLARQGRTAAEKKDWWQRLCLSASELPGFESWGAICDGRLVAAFLAFCCEGCYVLPYEQSATEYINKRVNNALFYHVTHEALHHRKMSSVFFGLQSLDAPMSVDQFKFRMGYKATPVRQRVVFHPYLALFANKACHQLLAWLRRRCPGNYVFSKTEGMLRFYIQGKRTMHEQELPDDLLKQLVC